MSLFRSPLIEESRITSTFAAHKSDGRANFAGIDLVYANGSSFRRPVVATSKQKVLTVQNDFFDPKQPMRQGEKYVYTQDVERPEYTFMYLHNDENLVSAGQILQEGQELSKMGYSGWTVPDNSPQGTHLHYEVRKNGVREDPALTTDFNKFTTAIKQSSPTQINFNMSNSITVQAGWGLSNVVQAAGLPMTETSYEHIYNLNQGWRGSTDWKSLNARMGPNDVLKVRPDVQATPVNNPVIDVNNEANEWRAKYNQAITDRNKIFDDLELSRNISKLEEEKNRLRNEENEELKEKVALLSQQIEDMKPTMAVPSLSIPKDSINKVDQELSGKVSQNIENLTGQKVDSTKISDFIGGRVKKLTSTRLWSAIGGTFLTAQIGDSATQTIISAVVLFSLYIISEAYIYYTNKG